MTKILFVTGSFLLGRSGVADYIFSLSHALHGRGVQSACIALNEQRLFDFSDYPDIPSQAHLIPAKSLSLEEAVMHYSPDWISLQYVPYSFNAKGIPLNLLNLLSSLRQPLFWHIMLHELWVDPASGIKNRLLSKLQREILCKILNTIQPLVTHTTNYWYRDQLRGIGFPSEILPLFSNIPYVNIQQGSPQPNRFEWNFLLFGSINNDWCAEPLLTFIEQARRAHGVHFCRFVSVGHLSGSAIHLWDSLDSLSYPAFSFCRMGELSPEEVSIHMQRADFGISVTPSHLIGKSASAAAMHAHGLPIIINRLSEHCVDWQNHLKQSGHYILTDDSFVTQMGFAKKFQAIDCLDTVANQFISSLRQPM